MGNYEVYRSETFDRRLLKFPENVEKIINNFENQLEENPYVGKPLGFKWFREKKFERYRVYYLIYEDLKVVYIITLSGKKDQQKAINTIKQFLDKYRNEIEDLIKKDKKTI